MSQTSGTPPNWPATGSAAGTVASATAGSGGPPPDEALVVTGRMTWGKMLAWNSGIIVVGLGAIFALISLVYGGLKDNIADVKSRVDAIDQTLKVAIQSATSVQTLITQTPKLEERISATHDVVTRDIPVLTTRLENVDKKTDNIAQAITTLQRTLDRKTDDISQKIGSVQQSLERLQTQTNSIQERLPRPR